MIKQTIIVVSALFSLSGIVKAQEDAKISYSVESSITTSKGEYSPLWLNANRQGLSSVEKNNAYMAVGIFHSLEKDKNFSYGYGLELAGAHNLTADFMFQQAYLDLKYKNIGLSVGSKERNGEFVNQQLSSGGLTLSGNARPVPQVWAGLPDYVTIPGTNHWLSFRGHIAYGRFTDGKWQESFAGPHVRIKADDIRNSQTINDLYNRVIQELSNNDATAINECKVISAEKPEVVTKKI